MVLGNIISARARLAAVIVLAALPAAALAAEGDPSASFSFSPENPRSGDNVRFTSSSCDPGGRLAAQTWDLDGDGQYDDAEGPAADRRFVGAGSHVVGLMVTDADGTTDTQRRTVMVDTTYALPRPDSARLMSPFPVVTLGGRVGVTRTRVTQLTVRAPVCSVVVVSCRGRGCPLRRTSAFVGRRDLRIRRAQRKYRAGSILTVTVSKDALIGKASTFRFRRARGPVRRDRCLRPGATTGSRCPR